MAFLWHDVRDAWRALLHSRGYTLVVLLTLGVGIGVNAAIFTVVDAVFLRPLPYPSPDRLALVAEWPRTGGNFTMAPAAYLQWRQDVRSFSAFEARVGAPFVLLGEPAPEQVAGTRVTPGYLAMLGARPYLGRLLTDGDAVPGAPCAMVVTYRLWTARLGADREAMGRPLRFSGGDCTLVGVLAPDSPFDRGTPDVFAPLVFSAADARNQGRQLTVIGRLREGVTLDQARAEMATLAESFNRQRGEAGRGWSTAITPWRDVVIRSNARRLALILGGTVSVVLLVACLNVAGLSLTRAAGRRREVAIRASLGASRSRLLRYLVVESLLLAFTGGALGVLLASWVLRALTALAPQGLFPADTPLALDSSTLLFTFAVSTLAGLAFGTAPALRGTADPATLLASSVRTVGPTRGTSALQRAILVAEVALATVTVVAGASLTVSFARLVRVDPGFSAQQVLTMRVAIPSGRYTADGAASRYLDDLLDAFRQVNGVTHAGAVTSLPLDGWLFGTTFRVEGEPIDGGRAPSAHIQSTTAGYFEALSIPLAAGRTLTDDDDRRGAAVAVVNETLVKRFMRGTPAIGRRIHLGADGQPFEIVGVLRDVKTGGLDDAELATPEIYVPHRQNPARTMYVAVSAGSGPTSALVSDLRAAARGVDSEVPLGTPVSMAARIGDSVRQQRFRTAMVGASAALALLLAAVGVYAVRSQAVAARIREMGIRLALGATRRDLLRMTLVQGLVQVGTGAVIGLAAASTLRTSLEPWLFATGVAEPRVLAATAALLIAAALVASWMPARRAAGVDPLLLLRQE